VHSFTWPGGSVTVTDGRVEVWVFREGAPPVAVIETSAPPLVVGTALRASGLWLSVTEESSGHWSVGFEAFGLELDDPDDTFGIPIPVGLDLEWEDDPTPEDCLVTGEVLVGDQAIQVNGRGRRLTST
jgi:hypothetical protein